MLLNSLALSLVYSRCSIHTYFRGGEMMLGSNTAPLCPSAGASPLNYIPRPTHSWLIKGLNKICGVKSVSSGSRMGGGRSRSFPVLVLAFLMKISITLVGVYVLFVF